MAIYDDLKFSNPNYEEKESLAEFTAEELKICERISFIDYAIHSEDIPTNPEKPFPFNTDPDSMEFDLYVNFIKFADPTAYYELYKRDEFLRPEIALRLLYYDILASESFKNKD